MKTSRRLVGALVVAALAAAALPALAEDKAVVNINTASAAQLQLLPRVGPAIAQRIVEFRAENGPFKSADQLLLVRGIGEATFELMKPYVVVSGETTLQAKVRTPRAAASAKQG